MPADPPPPGPLASLPQWQQWAVLVAASLVLVVGLEFLRVPAALLIGAMVAAIALGVSGVTIRAPRPGFNVAQMVMGSLLAGAIRIDILGTIAADWLLVALAVVSTVAASSFLGWSISRLRILPGTTAVWGSAPGASTAMVLMAETFGADVRLVAFMQYLRVVMVTLAAAFIARIWVEPSAAAQAAHVWFPPIDAAALGGTILVAALGGAFGRLLRLPSPYFLGAFIVGIAFNLGGIVTFQHPQWLLAASYAVIGWTVGLRFDRAIVLQAARALPQIVLSILLLMGFCGGIAWLLVMELGIDPLTAYLATSPGGLDSVAIIAAASSTVDLSLIMALQTARFLFVLVFGPVIARFVARSVRF
jgi:membrane AbrB-like protein